MKTKYVCRLSDEERLELARKTTEIHFPEEWRNSLTFKFCEMFEDGNIFVDEQDYVKISYLDEKSQKKVELGFVALNDFGTYFCNNFLRKLQGRKKGTFLFYPPMIVKNNLVSFDVSQEERAQWKISDEIYRTEMTKKFGSEYEKEYKENHENKEKFLHNQGLISCNENREK